MQADNRGMDEIDLENFTLKRKEGQVTATHRKAKKSTTFPVKVLERWLTQRLREDLTSFLKGK